MQWLSQNKCRILLTTLVLLLVAYPVCHQFEIVRVLLNLLVTAIFVMIIVFIFPTTQLRVVGLCLGVPTLLGLWTVYFFPSLPRPLVELAFHLCGAIFFLGTTMGLLWAAQRSHTVTAESVCGVLAGYLLVGLGFGHLHYLVEIFAPGSYAGDGFLIGDAETRKFLLMYFSFLTLTTVGYGDIVPSSPEARGLAMLEAIVGQFYLAVLVADLISKRSSQSTSEEPKR